jgi:hypothetical protein
MAVNVAIPTTVCLLCGKPLATNKIGIVKYCGYEHAYAAARTGKVERTCLYCGKVFLAYKSEIARGGGKYCCPEHSQIGQKGVKRKSKKVKTICQYCGKEFMSYPDEHRKYHCKSCANKANNPPEAKVPVTCAYCGKVKYYPPAKAKTVKYCNNICKNKAHEKKIKRICKQCGKEFYATPSEVKRMGGVFHERECWNKYHVGKNCSTWKDGNSFGKYCPKFNPSLKRRVRDFFGHKCVLCGKLESELPERLHIHHVDYTKEDCCNGNRDPLFVPLCRSCHARTNNDREEWELFFRYYLALGYNNKCY